jgi:predicted PurR-regulated permease PerM
MVAKQALWCKRSAGAPDIQKNLQAALNKFSSSPMAAQINQSLETALSTLQGNIPQILQAAEKVLAGIVTRTVNILGYIVNFLVFAVVSVYLLKDFHKVTANASDILPAVYREPVLGVMHKIDVKLRGFFRGQVVVGTILAGIYVIGFAIVGVPFALILALVGGYGQIVPYMGTALAIVLRLLTLVSSKTSSIRLALLVFVIGQSPRGHSRRSRVMGDKIGLHPVAIILAILVFGKLLGFLGILVAVPLASVIMVLLSEVMTRYKQSSLFSNQTDDDSTSN